MEVDDKVAQAESKDVNYDIINNIVGYLAEIKHNLGIVSDTPLDEIQKAALMEALTNIVVVIGSEMMAIKSSMITVNMVDDDENPTWAVILKLLPPEFMKVDVDMHKRIMNGEFDKQGNTVIIEPTKKHQHPFNYPY